MTRLPQGKRVIFCYPLPVQLSKGGNRKKECTDIGYR